jgi:hypothetical protein
MPLGHLMQGKPHAGTPGVTIGTPRTYELCGALCFVGRRHRGFTHLAELSGAADAVHLRDGVRGSPVGCGAVSGHSKLGSSCEDPRGV